MDKSEGDKHAVAQKVAEADKKRQQEQAEAKLRHEESRAMAIALMQKVMRESANRIR